MEAITLLRSRCRIEISLYITAYTRVSKVLTVRSHEQFEYTMIYISIILVRAKWFTLCIFACILNVWCSVLGLGIQMGVILS